MTTLTRCKNCTKQYPADGRGNLCPACYDAIVEPKVRTQKGRAA